MSSHDGDGGEQQPLLLRQDTQTKIMQKSFFTPLRRMLLVVFTLSFTFGLTNTPMLFAYRVLTCQEYYRHHKPYEGSGDQCAIPAIDVQTAKAVSVMVVLTTIGGVLNLLTTGWLQRNFGVRATLLNQSLWPLFRNAGQILGIWKGGKAGLTFFQITQAFTIFGGGPGYLLSANNYVGAVVEPHARTGSFGQLQGVAMAGTALAFTVGGMLNDNVHATAPFFVTLALLFLSTIQTYLVLPYVAPKYTEGDTDKQKGEKKRKQKKRSARTTVVEQVKGFFRPLKVFKTRRLEDWDGKNYYGVTLLAIGMFVSVLATAYVPLMLQLFSTNIYGFRPTQNGYLMSTFALVRAMFLTFAFPHIIDYGRKWYAQNDKTAGHRAPLKRGASTYGSTRDRSDPPRYERYERYERYDGTDGDGMSTSSDPSTASSSSDESEVDHHHSGYSKESEHQSAFDLVFLRWSCFFDAVLTAALSFSTKGWQMYIAGGILPLASATAPAAKGVVMEMVTTSEKPEALSGLALIELLATVICQSAFGGLFTVFSKAGKPNLIFLANGATALVATVVLIFVRLPPSPEEVDDDNTGD